MSNKGKRKCASCGCNKNWIFKEEIEGEKKYYCSSVCFRNKHPKQQLWGELTCESCGMHMRYSSSPMFAYDHEKDKLLLFCCEFCYAYYFGMLDETSFYYKDIDDRNRRFVKQEKENNE